MGTIKSVSIPTKTLAQNLASNGTTLYISDTLSWDGSQMSSADFGTQAFATLRNASNSQLEFIEIDPSTVTSSNAITISKRGLGYDGSQVAGAETAYDWLAGDTYVELGSSFPQLLKQLVEEAGDETVAGVKTFSSIPKTTGGNPTDDTELARKAYVDATATGTTNINRIVVAGTAGATLADGNLIYFDDTDNEWKLCDADTSTTVENVLLGIAQGAGTDGGAISGGVLLFGVDDAQTGMTIGDPMYASNTAGGISASVGTTEVSVGIAKSATELYFMPRYTTQLTASQQDALAGTSGTPSSSNKYVTNDDTASAATADKVARRNATGDVTVPTTPSASTDAASKSYVDSNSGEKVATVVSDVTVNNTVTETALFTQSISANTLGTAGGIKVTCVISDLDIANSHTVTFKLKYGSTTIATLVIGEDGTTNLTNRSGLLVGYLLASGATNTQEGSLTGMFGTKNFGVASTDGNNVIGTAVGTAAEDSTGALNLVITGTNSSASTSTGFTFSHAIIEKIR